jgi:hypothetical protein
MPINFSERHHLATQSTREFDGPRTRSHHIKILGSVVTGCASVACCFRLQFPTTYPHFRPIFISGIDCPVNSPLIISRPRCARDFTVPIGTP